MHRFERTVGTTRYFREIARDGRRCRVREGIAGTAGTSTNTLHHGATEALDEVARRCIAARNEGYDLVPLSAERIAFEKKFGPVKRLVPANDALLDCRMPGGCGSGPAVSRDAASDKFAGGRERTGPSYYRPDRRGTAPLFRARLWNTGFYRLGVDGGSPPSWRAVTEAATTAWAIAGALAGVVLSSDIDASYAPFFFPKPPPGTGPKPFARFLHEALGCRLPPEIFRCTRVKRPERFFWAADENPEDYYVPDDLVSVHRATALLRQSLDDLILVSMDEALVNYPIFYGGFTPSGLYAGVFAVRCDT